MIPPEILRELVPDHDPDEDFPRDARLSEIDPENPERRIGLWANYLRYRISREVEEEPELAKLLDTSGVIGTGVFRVPSMAGAGLFEGFPVVGGLQFGAMLFRGMRDARADGDYIRGLSMESGRFQAPLIQTLALFNPHVPRSPDGYVAVTFKDDDGEDCGITAAHVASGYRRGERVPVLCSLCGDAANLEMRAPGFIDAAKISFRCGGPRHMFGGDSPRVRGAVEGETVEAHLGNTGKAICTVMLSLSTLSQLISAATPKHFLMDRRGHPGDSGSLVSGQSHGEAGPDLIGMYLGDSECEYENGSFMTYGYGLDLQQAAAILGARDLRGVFNV